MTCFEILTDHAQQRIGQRSRQGDVALVCRFADQAVPSGPGKEACFISRKALKRLQEQALLSAQEVERLFGLTVVVAEGGTVVVTVIKDRDGVVPARQRQRGHWQSPRHH